ncbi:hypothetical protein FHR81_005138 [Actinoalloteichus hoggarensis]|uniref:Uncharacterized protein n=1 Tax=Actinoalloteichus hoggarensis TaxID=1470176 RepID=A0A221WBZ0_9PSEU|nr:DUF397 domain-containing protein [Actinoalloteichus hoggarensis]ASO22797.1 hypothetical protein AHOG_25960 [Actinoalloteichus hoggarensis]MBB5924061.1 hypothetical protein [Actinoalloteichus hoggarensis]
MNDWRTSSRSNGQGQCVEIRRTPGCVRIRDTKDRAGATLLVGRRAFDALVTALRADRLDRVVRL